MKKIALMLMLLTILSKILGFGREITLSYFYGASNISDAFLVSRVIPFLLFEFVGIGIVTSYIPVVSTIIKEKGMAYADKFTSNLVNLVFFISSFIILLVLIFTVPIIKVFASGFEDETLRMAVTFTRIGIFSIYFTSCIYVYRGYLQVKNNFIVPELIGFPLNVAIISFIVLSYYLGLNYLAIGSIVAGALQLLFFIPFLTRKKYKYSFFFDIKDEYLRKMVNLSVPVIIGVSVNQINLLVDRTIASRIAEGAISSLNYANGLNLFVQSVFVMSFTTVMYPMISKMVIENNIYGLKKSLLEAIELINLLVIPATIGFMLFTKPIITMVYGRGAFDSEAISMTSYALFFYSIGMIGFGLREVLSRVFYSLQDVKTPMINAAVGMALNIVLNLILSRYLGIGGLALATSIAAIFTTGLMFISLRKKIGSLGLKLISISLTKILLASLTMGLFAKLSFNYLTANIFSHNISLIITILIGALFYFVLIYLLKIEYAKVIVNSCKEKINKRIR